MRMKYIIFETDVSGYIQEHAIIFSEFFIHKEVADTITNCKPVSAGFLSTINGQAVCIGDSVSLGIKSRGSMDMEVIARMVG